MKRAGAMGRGVMAVAIMCVLADGTPAPAVQEDGAIPVALRTLDLDLGETGEAAWPGGGRARVRLISLEEDRDPLRHAVREARVTVDVNGATATLVSASYRLPVAAGGVQIDCPVTRGYTANDSKGNAWALRKDARVRLWPAGSPWMEPGTFGYPLRQRWFAGWTQMGNEPCFVNACDTPGLTNVYYHYGLDFGGCEGITEVVAATDGLVVSAAGTTLPAHTNSPAKPRYDVIYIRDARDWYYRYSHLHTIDVKPGDTVKRGQRIGLLGKEGGSGGWSHLHFDLTSRQPSGQWGVQDAYAYVWEAYRREYSPRILAVARPHRLVPAGATVTLDGSLSWSAGGRIARHEWTFDDGTTAAGPRVQRTYPRPGTYAETLRVVGPAGEVAYDFAVVQVADPARRVSPPSIHASFHPTAGIRPGDPVTFKVRSFGTTHGEETWDFGDGSAPVKVKSDGNVKSLARDGYAVTEHRFKEAGRYLVGVERANERGETAAARLYVEVGPAP